MNGEFVYTLKGRRHATLLGLGVVAGLLVLAAVAAAPWYIWVIWGGTAASMLWAVLRNPISGCRITADRLSWHSGGRETVVELDEITTVHLTSWSDGPDTCRIGLASGKTAEPPTICLPGGAVLERELSARGVAVSRH